MSAAPEKDRTLTVDELIEHADALDAVVLREVGDVGVIARMTAAGRARLAPVLALDAVTLGVTLSLLPADHVLVVAARSGLEVGELRHQAAVDDKAAAVAISEAADWRRLAYQPSHAELVRRRFPPDGDREQWTKFGPDGSSSPGVRGVA